jgi:hypothetical protein
MGKALFLLLVSAVNDLVLVSETENMSARAKYSLSRKKASFYSGVGDEQCNEE